MLVSIKEINKEEIAVVSSRDIAEETGKQHKHVIETIEKIIADANSAVISAQWIFKSSYKDDSGKSNKEYLLAEQGVNLYFFNIQGYNEQKIKYILAFDEMKKYIKRMSEERSRWEIERAKGVLVRHILTDTIKMKIAESPNKRFMYPNYTKLIYKVIFGKPFKELQQEFSIKPKESLRDYLTSEQLKEVEQMEMLVSSLIGIGMGYEEIKNFINDKYNSTMLIAG